MHFFRTSITRIEQECGDLVADNCDRAGMGDPQAINWETYRQAEEGGGLHVIGAESGGVLVGYVVWIVFDDPKDINVVTASSEAFYLAPCYRPHAYHLLRWCEQYMARYGVERLYHQFPVGTRWGRAIQRAGYEPLQTVYRKDL